MFGTQTRVAMFGYVAGLFGFGLYSVFTSANVDLPGALAYGAQWPMLVFHLV